MNREGDVMSRFGGRVFLQFGGPFDMIIWMMVNRVKKIQSHGNVKERLETLT